MCGIAGFFGNFSSELLARMGDSLNHRGPDGQGEVLISFQGQQIGLSHRRLSILDLSSAGAQPMKFSTRGIFSASSDSLLWISFNGEIYNFLELKSELIALGHQFNSQTDTEVILHLYDQFGIQAFRRLNGIFALAIYDGRESGQRDGITKGDLLLFRDGLGVKPLYYSETSKGFLFASEIKALMCSSEVPKDLDLQAIKNCMSYLYSPAPRTPFSSIKKVEPGEWLLVRNGQIKSKNYFYDIPYGETIENQSEEELTEKLRDKLKRSVKRQLISDVPVGAFLSGGMDSTSVVALMKEAEPSHPFQCFTIGYDQVGENQKDDLFYARRVAANLNLPLSVVHVEPSDFKSLETALYHLDEPQADPAAINAMLISKKAREMGIKVLLSGAGGDDIFSGYPRHITLELDQLWRRIPSPVLKMMAQVTHKVSESSYGATLISNPMLRKVAKVLESLKWDSDSRLSSYFMCTYPDSAALVLGERFRGESDSFEETLDPFLRSLKRVKNEKNLLNRMLYLETKHFLADHNLNYVDKMSMSQGVEVRVPLIDLELVNFVAQIPPQLKRKKLENKYIFKKAVAPFVPEEVLKRPKQGFGLPIRKWLNTELREIVQDSLSESSLRQRGLFDPQQVRRLIKMDQEKKIDATFLIFSLLSIELWCRQFLDKSYSTSHSKERLASFPL